METIIGYRFKLYYDSTLLHEDDEVYETEEEAREMAEDLIKDYIDMWEFDGGWHPENGDSRDCFDVVIVDVVDEEEDENE